MCGIGGFIAPHASKEWRQKILTRLLLNNRGRGRDATGIGFVKNNEILILKDGVSAEDFIAKEEYKKATAELPSIVLGHCRAATKGVGDTGAGNKINNHPFLAEEAGIAMIHNGLIQDHEKWRETIGKEGGIKNTPTSKVDSEIFLRAVESFYLGYTGSSKGNMENAIDDACYSIAGSYTLAFIKADQPNSIWFVKHGNPLFLAFLKEERAILYASTEDSIKESLAKKRVHLGYFTESVEDEAIINNANEDWLVRIDILADKPWFDVTTNKLDVPTSSWRAQQPLATADKNDDEIESHMGAVA